MGLLLGFFLSSSVKSLAARHRIGLVNVELGNQQFFYSLYALTVFGFMVLTAGEEAVVSTGLYGLIQSSSDGLLSASEVVGARGLLIA